MSRNVFEGSDEEPEDVRTLDHVEILELSLDREPNAFGGTIEQTHPKDADGGFASELEADLRHAGLYATADLVRREAMKRQK